MKKATYDNATPRTPASAVRTSKNAHRWSALIAAGIIIASPCQATLAYNQTITAIFGSGNPNTGWTADTSNGIQLALRAKGRNDSAYSGLTPNDGAGTYAFPLTIGARGPFNYEFSINSDAIGVKYLDQYEFYLAADTDPSADIAYSVVNALSHWSDNSYGSSSTANGAGTEGLAADLADEYHIAQNSQNITFGDYPGGGLPLVTNATYTYELFAVASGTGPTGSRLASVRINVVVGAGGAVPMNPVVSDVQAPPVAENTKITVTAKAEGSLPIASASYAFNGVPVGGMLATDGAFDGQMEAVNAAFLPGLPVGVYNVAVSARDTANRLGSATTLLAVYDPSAGFVTGGGWINSPAGAYRGPNAWQTRWEQLFATDASGWSGAITPLGNGTARVDGSAYSYFDGYHNVWPGTWIAEIDVYLDSAAPAGSGFDYTVAANGTNGAHRRDYIFHVTKDISTGKLLVGGSNNTNNAPRQDLETIHHYEVLDAGWYTLQHRFFDAGGYLAVDLNLLDSSGHIVFTETRADMSDTIPAIVGGNRYAWFTFVAGPDGILVDNHQRFEFGTITGKANFGFVSKYQKGANVPTGSTEFVFSAGGLNFHSSSYEWLVVNQNGTNAQFKGVGTINGSGEYGFMIWATDNAGTSSADTFRIQIWDKLNGDAIVYDNGVDQVIGGGNILVQTSKK